MIEKGLGVLMGRMFTTTLHTTYLVGHAAHLD